MTQTSAPPSFTDSIYDSFSLIFEPIDYGLIFCSISFVSLSLLSLKFVMPNMVYCASIYWHSQIFVLQTVHVARRLRCSG